MGRGALVAGAALVVLGGGALGYGVTRKAVGGMTPIMTSAVDGAIGSLDGDIKAARAAVAQRAKSLGEINLVRDTIGTDAATVKDQVGREIGFKTDGGEVIELGQIDKADGKTRTLVILPDGGMRATYAGQAGMFGELADDQLYITTTVEVVPSDGKLAAAVTGYVTVSKPLDLAPAIAGLVKVGLSGRIEVGDKRKDFGSPADNAATWETKPIPSQPNTRVLAMVPPIKGGMPIPVVGAGAGVAGLGVILVLIGLMTGKDRTGNTQLQMSAHTGQSVGSASTLLSTSTAAGTPSPVDLARSPMINPGTIGAGALIGRWEVVRRLGSGGMADVYLCHARGEAGFEKLVALKLMHPHLARNQRAVDHFLDEARLAARVHHPNVVAIQDLGKIGADYVIVMEYVDGVDLERLLTNARAANRLVPVNVALGILCRICDGLHAAHTAVGPDGQPMGIIHRDVKAANVLVSKQGGVKVVDFGIAKAATQAHNTIAGETKGTPSMMAPEQRVGEQVDVRADVYSVGAVAFEVLTGHAVNLDLAALAHLGVENWPHLPPPSTLRPGVPPELDQLLLASMAFERDKRPANCAAYEGELEAVMKRNNLSASDKDIARWVASELRELGVEPATSIPTSKPAGIS